MFRKPPLEDLLDNGRDHYVALLRSFEDDEGFFESWGRALTGFPSPSNPVPMRNDWRSFEEMLEFNLRLLGEVIAVNKKESGFFTPPGATRYWGGLDKQWQLRVSRFLSEQCRIVVFVLGSSPGLLWEFAELVKIDQPSKLILVFPPIELAELQKRWQGLRDQASSVDLPPEIDGRSLFATFSRTWECEFILGTDIDRRRLSRASSRQSALFRKYEGPFEEILKRFPSEEIETQIARKIYKKHFPT
jgi:hypothetical protein